MHNLDVKKQQILDRVSVLDLVSQHVTLRRVGRRWVGLCPFHAEKTPSFTVNPDLGLFKCFGCGKGGDIFNFVQFRENVPFMEAMHLLADRAGVELASAPSADPAAPTRHDLARVNTWAARHFSGLLAESTGGEAARRYVAGRGISPAAAERFGLGLAVAGGSGLREAAGRAGFAPALLVAADLLRQDEQGRAYETFRNRLMFPIRDVTGRVLGFGGRTLGDDPAKYLNTRQTALFDKGRGLYGIDLARQAIGERERAVVVEGYTDCMAAHQAGFVETVATLGTALTEAHVDLLRRYAEEIIVLFDSDRAGEAAADRAISVALPRCARVRLARIPDGKDPCDFLLSHSAERFSDILNEAVDALEFKWSQTRKRFDGDASNAGRREALRDFLRVVAEGVNAGAVDVIQRGLLVNQVAHLLHLDPAEVDRHLGGGERKYGQRRQASVPVAPAAAVTAAAPLNEEQAAWVHALEVVLAEPGLLPALAEWLAPERIVESRDRRIATVILGLGSQGGELRLADVLARCADPDDVQRASQLAERGAARGNFEATLKVACERIESAVRAEDVGRRKARLLHGAAQLEDTRAELASISEHMKQQRHFAPRRLIPQTADIRSVVPTGGGDL
ncbi:MAG: DNA primase [Planctomycetes bacterium]|nr:DNA primase [Planctomycetota bacterium]